MDVTNQNKPMKTKVNQSISTVLGMAMVVTTQLASAQTWQTVYAYQYVTGKTTAFSAMAADSGGNLYVAGYGIDASILDHGVVLGSSDHGATWVQLDDLFYASPTNQFSEAHNGRFCAIGVDPAQNIYAVAAYPTSAAPYTRHLTVRKSADLGATWSTALDLPYTYGFVTYSSPGFAADRAGRIYVAIDTGTPGPLVAKSANAGATWTTVNPLGTKANLNGIVSTAAGVFVCGSDDGPGGYISPNLWGMVRKSVDGGASWQTVDSFNPTGYNGTGYATAICADLSGNIYVAGTVQIITGKGRSAVTSVYYVVRRGTNGGTKWQTITLLPIPSAFTLVNIALGVDLAGNLYANGQFGPASNGSGAPETLKSMDGGSTWNVVDLEGVGGFACDRFGTVYAVGSGSSDTGPGTFGIVRKQVTQ